MFNDDRKVKFYMKNSVKILMSRTKLVWGYMIANKIVIVLLWTIVIYQVAFS